MEHHTPATGRHGFDKVTRAAWATRCTRKTLAKAPPTHSRWRTARFRGRKGEGLMFGKAVLPVVSLVFAGSAAPPGAMVRTKLDVPGALRNGTFTTDRYLNIPPGFQISLFASVAGARFMAVAPNGDVLVSQPNAGQVTLLRPVAGGLPQSFTFVSGLRTPHDIVFSTANGVSYVYIAETNQINRYRYVIGDTAAHDRQVVITGLPLTASWDWRLCT